MKKILATSAITSALLIANSTAALAQSNSNLDKRLKALEAKIAKSSSSKSPLATAFESAKITGRLHVDARFYNENDTLGDNANDGVDIKRARLGIKGRLSKNLKYKFENDFADNKSKIKDAYIAYDGIKNVEFKLGQFKQSFSLEELTSSNNITFIDRSVAVKDAPSRTVGFQGSVYGKNWQLAAGIFGESTGNGDREDDSNYSASARASYAPVNSGGKLVHLGVASAITSSDRNESDGNNGLQAKSTDKESLYGAEFALGLNSFSLQGEYILNETEYDNGINSGVKADYDSYYVQASYILTGEHRVYKAKSGKFAGVKVKNPVGTKGGTGAIELAARISKSDKNDDNGAVTINGGLINQTTLGVNWYLNNNSRLMANYVKSKIDTRAVNQSEYDAFLLRAQVNF